MNVSHFSYSSLRGCTPLWQGRLLPVTHVNVYYSPSSYSYGKLTADLETKPGVVTLCSCSKPCSPTMYAFIYLNWMKKCIERLPGDHFYHKQNGNKFYCLTWLPKWAENRCALSPHLTPSIDRLLETMILFLP